MSYNNWKKLYELTEKEQYRMLLCFTRDISPQEMHEMCQSQKRLSIDASMWNEASRFRAFCAFCEVRRTA